jgi:Ca2+-binding EF-hand superfamily protein
LDGDGVITIKEIAKLLEDLGNRVTVDSVKDFLNQYDVNGNDVISFEEFLEVELTFIDDETL